MNEIYRELVLGIITLVVTCLGGIVTKFISTKISQTCKNTEDTEKQLFFIWLEDLVEKCINTTTQTYVQELKKAGKFGAAEQKIALQKTTESVMTLLTDANTTILNNYVGDVTTWITVYVEDYIKRSKNS